jgi:hypothetical protein
MLESIDLNPEYITEAYDLKAQTVIDYLNDTDNLRERVSNSTKEANELSETIIDNLVKESANNLAMICTGYGLVKKQQKKHTKAKETMFTKGYLI